MVWVTNTLGLFLEAAPWLVVGLILAGLIKAWIAEDALSRWLGGTGFWPVVKGALIGAPMPLCSCGVLPAAVGLHRAGASKGATTSFLVATPETGPDSLALSYALLGPFMAFFRPIAAVFSAILSGGLAALTPDHEIKTEAPVSDNCCSTNDDHPPETLTERTISGLKFAFTEMMDDIGGWLIVGFLVAGAAVTQFPPMALAEYGSGITAMLVMLAAGIPLYVCASASTPIAAAMIIAGVSPGTTLVFLLVGPATNFASIAILSKELGKLTTAAYLGGLSISAILSGLALDWLVNNFNIDIAVQASSVHSLLPHWLELGSAILLAFVLARPFLQQGRTLIARAL
ncbi:MAG: SO_0444 family Cu/Zn efflux transporter [Rhodospirillales bacterium]|nr:SO_0444 family Cu/Zn efflux transporter [Rhodospirillales bacterium]